MTYYCCLTVCVCVCVVVVGGGLHMSNKHFILACVPCVLIYYYICHFFIISCFKF